MTDATHAPDDRFGSATERGGRGDGLRGDTSRRQFLGLAASLSALPIPRPFDIETVGGDPTVTRARPVDATLGRLSAASYVERYTETGGVRVRSHAHQPAIPIEVIVDTGWTEASLGLDPAEARWVARRLLAAARACEGQSAEWGRTV